MNQFNGSIDVDGEKLSFDFSLIHTTKGLKFFITVVKARGYFVFDMQKNDSGKWKILDPAPLWVRPFEVELSYIIAKHI